MAILVAIAERERKGGASVPPFLIRVGYNTLMLRPRFSYKVPDRSMRVVRRHWLTITFFLGFVVDNFTLNRVDQVFDNIILATYVVLAMVALLTLYAGVAGKLPERMLPYARQYAPLFVQFAFGGLLSGMLIFYSRSGSWEASWPFLLVILAVIYGNETIRDRANRLIFNLGIFFIGLSSYVILVIPVFTGYMGAWVFIASGLVALSIMYLFVQVLYYIIPRFMELKMKSIVFTLGCIYFGLNFLYFTNIIPPIPLSLKDVGIYHSVIRFDDGRYQLKYEEGAWWQFLKDSDDTFHARAGDNVYCFAKVFAPTKIETTIFHTWEYKNAAGDWIEHARLPYPITGGRDDGFRGFTVISNYQDGEWRCSVETARGQIVGREEFTIDSTSEPRALVTREE